MSIVSDFQIFYLKQKKNIDISNYSKNDARIFGFLGERLLDVWLKANNLKYFENAIIYFGRQNWIKKRYQFIIRKIIPKNELF